MHQLLRFLARPQQRDARNASAHHRDFIAAMQPRAALAVLEDLVRQLGLVFHRAKAVAEKEIRNAREQADGLNAVLFGFVNQCARMRLPAPLLLASGFTTIERTSHRCGP